MVAAELVGPAFGGSSDSAAQPVAKADVDWRQLVRPYTESQTGFAVFQLVSTLAMWVGCLTLMFATLGDIHYAWTILLAFPAGGLAVRLFVLFHDCCHLSFLPSTRANEIVGIILGPFVFTSYHHWRLEHNYHHATSGNLDKRGVGDVPTFTLAQYEAFSPLQKFGYRLLRNPFLLFSVSAVFTFVVLHRFWGPVATRREKLAVVLTDLAVVALWGGLMYAVGPLAFLKVIGPMTFISASSGVWLFYVQHQFPDTYWRHADTWSYKDAALKGSSFYNLPAVLQYFAGNIGFHHIHHLSPKVPNYRLKECHRGVPEFQVKGMTILESLACVRVNLIDDKTLRPLSFGERPTT